MTRIALLSFILATWTGLANCARPHAQPLVPKPEEPKPSAAPSTSPSNSDCSTMMPRMMNCIGFLSDGIVVPTPDVSCCNGFKDVAKAGPDCLCEFFKNGVEMGMHLNMAKAATLPSACGMKNAPPLPSCDAKSPKSGSPVTPSPKSSRPWINMVPSPTPTDVRAPAPSPSSGAYSISAKLAFAALSMLSAASLM